MTLSLRLRALFLGAILVSSASANENWLCADSTYFRTTRYGPFDLLDRQGDTSKVYVLVGHVHLDSAEYREWLELDHSFSFVDAHDRVLYRVNDRWEGGGCEKLIRAVQIVVPRVGPLVLVMSAIYPSAPNTGLEGRAYGLDPVGNVVPFSPIMSPSSDRMDNSSFRPVLIETRMGHETESKYTTDIYGTPAIETIFWTGNYAVFQLHPVWSSREAPIDLYQLKYRIEIDPTRAAAERARYRTYGDSDTTISLYSKPSKWKQAPKLLKVRVDSSIQFLDAVNNEGWWLHIIIDGEDGYVTDPDCPKLGLPDAG